MRTEAEITEQMDSIRERMTVLQRKTEEEMQKKFEERDYRLLRFLNKEYSVYEYALNQMEWILR